MKKKTRSGGVFAIVYCALFALVGCDSVSIVGAQQDASADIGQDTATSSDLGTPIDRPLECAAGQVACNGACVHAATAARPYAAQTCRLNLRRLRALTRASAPPA